MQQKLVRSFVRAAAVVGFIALIPGSRLIAQRSATIGVSATVIRGEEPTQGQALARAETARVVADLAKGVAARPTTVTSKAGVAQVRTETVQRPSAVPAVRVTLEYAAN